MERMLYEIRNVFKRIWSSCSVQSHVGL
jgi:hypothetical protein